jgi:DNA-directed RNA polymerase specialized sigma24 family protein
VVPRDQRPTDYRCSELPAGLRAAPALVTEELERVDSMLDAARMAPSAERALAQLTVAEQALFLLVARDELPVADAARALGLSSARWRVACGSLARGPPRSAPLNCNPESLV